MVWGICDYDLIWRKPTYESRGFVVQIFAEQTPIIICFINLVKKVKLNNKLVQMIEKEKLTRILFQILALGIFLFQMENSVLKYCERPVIQQHSTITYADIPPPVIYICQVSSHTHANTYLYNKDCEDFY